MAKMVGIVAFVLLAQATAPARGAPLSDIVPAAIVGAIAALLVIAFLVAHRRGRITLLARMSDWCERTVGLPGVAAIPVAVTTTSLLIAVFGFYWDVSWHIDRGRDPGPLANPAHWFIIVGLAGIALAGVLAVAMEVDEAEEGIERDPAGVLVRPGWTAPVGGVLLAVCGLIALAGFPLDDVWHRIFGQDVTLWGPTHIQMVGGASLATLAMWTLTVEGRRSTDAAPSSPRLARLLDVRDIASGGAFLIGLSTLQGEFDYGVPQFRQLYHPVLIALAASVALVAVRIRAGRGSALGAAALFIGGRGLLTLLIGPVLGRSTLHFPLYLAEALIVEAVALVVPRTRQLTLGLWAGLGIGTVGTLAEFGWSHAWMPLPWHAGLLPRALPLSALAGVGGGVVGGLIGRALAPVDLSRQPTPRGVAAVAWLACLAAVALPAPMTVRPATASVTMHEEAGPAVASADVKVDPPDAAAHADWFTVTAWQGARHGDGGLVIRTLHRTGPGVYRTDGTFPVYGQWKALLRLAKGSSVEVAPIYLPADPAIPAAGVDASLSFTRPFAADKKVLQREAVGGSLGLERGAYGVLAVLAMVWIGSLGWGLRRLDPSVARRSRGPARAVLA
jgi:hypothetical protein